MGQLALDGGSPAISYALPTVRDVSGRGIGEEELALVTEVVRSGNLGYIYGTKIKEFQNAWSSYYNVGTAVAVSSGTAALHSAMIFLNIGPGDEVLVPAITDMGTIIAVLYESAVPVFVDVDLHTQNMNPADLEKKITKKSKAIIPVHLFGFPCDMDPIMEIAEKYKLSMIEDCCQAHLTEYKGRLVGTFGNAGCFSFQQSKHMTTGDGGMVIAKEDNVRGRKLALCADKGWPREYYRDHLFLAPNYHMTELQAAVGIAQFRKLEHFIENRRSTAILLSGFLKEIEGVFPPLEVNWARNTYYEYALTIDPQQFKVNNEVLAKAITMEGVPATPGYLPKPIYMYSLVRDRVGAFKNDDCPIATAACKSMIYIPWNEKITVQHVADIAEAILKVLRYFKK